MNMIPNNDLFSPSTLYLRMNALNVFYFTVQSMSLNVLIRGGFAEDRLINNSFL